MNWSCGLIFRTLDLDSIRSVGNIGEFLDSESIEFASADIDLEVEGRRFRRTFDILGGYGEDVFRKYNQGKERFQGAFLNTAYEVIALGLGHHIDYYEDHPDEAKALDRAKSFGKILASAQDSPQACAPIPG